MINELERMWKEIDFVEFELLSQYLSGGAEGYSEKLQS
jgi:hypothetical protein